MASNLTKKSQDTIINVASIIISLLGLVLMVVSYAYIQKLENIKCQCSEHPHRKLIKNYLMFAIVWMLVNMFIPPSMVAKMNNGLAVAYGVANFVYGIATFIFFIVALRYVRFLMQEKCKCSEDLRREVLYVWSITEIVIISVLVILPVLVMTVMSSVGVLMSGADVLVTGTKELASKQPAAMTEAAMNPLKSLKKLPASLKKTSKMFGKK